MVNYIGLEAKLAENMTKEAHLTLWVLPVEVTAEQSAKVQAIIEEFRYYSIGARFKSFDNFGPAKDIPVLRVQNEQFFTSIRRKLTDAGLVDQSSYDFGPHVTVPVSMDPIIIPRIIPLSNLFLRIA